MFFEKLFCTPPQIWSIRIYFSFVAHKCRSLLKLLDKIHREKLNSPQGFAELKSWLILIFSMFLKMQLKFHDSIELKLKFRNSIKSTDV